MKILSLSKKVLLEIEGNTFKNSEFSLTTLRKANFRKTDLHGSSFAQSELSGSDFQRANLRRCYAVWATIKKADLRHSDLSYAHFTGADLSGSDMRWVKAKKTFFDEAILQKADLRFADLRSANLSYADLSEAKLKGAKLPYFEKTPYIKNIHKKVWEAVQKPGSLKMSAWDICTTTHCRGGWVIELSGEKGKDLAYLVGPSVAAALIYAKSDPKLEQIPDWYASNRTAMADMKRLAEL